MVLFHVVKRISSLIIPITSKLIFKRFTFVSNSEATLKMVANIKLSSSPNRQ